MYKDKERQKQYQREWIKKRRNKWLAENGPCIKCGSADRLQVDHIDFTKKVSHRIWSYSASKRNLELAKCQILCFSCHKSKTKAEGHSKGEKNAKAKLTENDVRAIRKLLDQGYSGAEIARRFKVWRTLIYKIKKGYRWAHVL